MAVINTSETDPIKALTSGIPDTVSWTGNTGQPATVNYTWETPDFGLTVSNAGAQPTEDQPIPIGVDQSGMLVYFSDIPSGTARTDFFKAVTVWENVANISFLEGTSSSSLIFGRADLPDSDGRSYFDTTTGINDSIGSVEAYLDIATHLDDFSPGGRAHFTIMHEVGHAIGLSHPHDANAIGEFTIPRYDFTDARFISEGLHSKDTTIMSDTNGLYTQASNSIRAVTLMLYDIAAVQFLYGVNTTYNSSATTYTLKNDQAVDINGVAALSGGPMTIWDGGSQNDSADTFVVDSSVTTNSQIDLRSGFATQADVDITSGDEYATVGQQFFTRVGAAGDAQNPPTIVFNALTAVVGANTHGTIENATGGVGNDTIFGNDVANTLQGSGGNDILFGNAGDDTLKGGDGADTIQGDAGSDFINGNGGDDSIKGFNDNDKILGGKDNDTINGNAGVDTVNGNLGNDRVLGGKDNDVVHGGQGNDTINGNNNDDTVFGDKGDDIVHGGKNDDSLLGGDGNDQIFGDLGNDTLNGGEGTDTFVFNADSGVDIIEDFVTGTDKIQISSSIFATDTVAVAAFSNGILNLGDGNLVTLTGITSVTEADFVIV